MNTEDTLCTNKFQKSEVDKMEWKNFEDCMSVIRYYNLEKKSSYEYIQHFKKFSIASFKFTELEEICI